MSDPIRLGDTAVKEDFETLLDGGHLHKTLDEQVVFGELEDDPDAIWPLLLASGHLKVLGFSISACATNGESWSPRTSPTGTRTIPQRGFASPPEMVLPFPTASFPPCGFVRLVPSQNSPWSDAACGLWIAGMRHRPSRDLSGGQRLTACLVPAKRAI